MKLINEHYSTQLKQLAPTFIGNHLPWLTSTREQSLARFLQEGFPNRHQENWKYTDLSFLAQEISWNCSPICIKPPLTVQSALENISSHQLVFIDGHFSAALSKIDQLPIGVTLTSLQEALMKQPEILKPHLEKNLSTPLINLNAAFVSDGVFLHVPKNMQVELPIHLLFLSSNTQLNNFINTKNIILLDQNSKAILLEEYAPLTFENIQSNTLVKNIVTQIVLKKNTYLDHYKLQQEPNHTVHLAQTDVEQAHDSQFFHSTISLGAKLARDDLNIALNDPGASCELNGFYALSDNQHTDHHTRVDHYSPHGTSKECYKGILNDHAKGVFNGKIVVHPQAQKTQSQQINKNLLLSTTAQMNTKPELEIYADDVQCTHGATVGQLELDALFYLRSRGLPEKEAINLLIHAFCEDVLARMKHPHIVNYIKKAVRKKIV